MKNTKTDENVLYVIGWILLLAVLVIAAAVKLWPGLSEKLPPCLFLVLTGFYCPGCGGTRAVSALMHGKVLASLIYHPFVLYTAVVGGWFMISHTIQKLSKGRIAIGMKYRDIYLWIALGLVAVNFVVKNAFLIGGIDLIEQAALI